MWLKLVRIVFFVFLGIFLLVGWIWNYRRNYGIYKMPTSSMEPTIKEGSKIKVNLSIYKSRTPERWDIVIFKRGNRTMAPERVIALPGETVQIKNGEIYINGKLKKKPEYIKNVYYFSDGGYGIKKTTIPKDCVFLLGDNSMSSKDSRYFGPIPLKSILGKVIRIYHPKIKEK